MRNKTLKNFLSFLLVLVLTICAVTALSMVTSAQTDPSLPVVEGAQPAAELSAAVPQGVGASPLLCAAAFAAVLAVVAGGLVLFFRWRALGKGGHRSYIPRADMAFAGGRARNRV